MIKYELTNIGTPSSIKLITDDANAEMAALEAMFVDSEWTEAKTFQNMGDSLRNSEGNFVFIIPGDEVGELAELIYDVDNGALERLMDKLNQEALDALE